MTDDIKPQHDFDEQKRIRRALVDRAIAHTEARYELTEKGREELEPCVVIGEPMTRFWYDAGYEAGFKYAKKAMLGR